MRLLPDKFVGKKKSSGQNFNLLDTFLCPDTCEMNHIAISLSCTLFLVLINKHPHVSIVIVSMLLCCIGIKLKAPLRLTELVPNQGSQKHAYADLALCVVEMFFFIFSRGFKWLILLLREGTWQ